MNTKDTVRDVVLDHDIRDLIFAFGKDYEFSNNSHKHNSYIALKNISFSRE